MTPSPPEGALQKGSVARRSEVPLRSWAASILTVILAVGGATALSWVLLGRENLADVVMVYLLGTVLVSLHHGYAASITAAVLSVLSFNVFFIPPYYTLAVEDPRHVVTFGVMFTVAVVITGLTRRARNEAEAARRFGEEASRARVRVETEQLKNALLSSVSHDFRTPLAVIAGAASAMLEARADPDARRELTETIFHEANRLDRLVQNLLDMTRVEAGALRVRREWHSMEEVVGSALERVERLLGDREVTTRLPGAPALAHLDALLVEQALVNLLENAARHTPPGSPVELSVELDERAVRVEVADRGPGVPSGEEARVFEKFSRGKSDRHGAGLGLAICRGIVLAHGGRIWVEARPGGGASFRFTLPVEGPAPSVSEEPVAPGEAAEA